VMETVSRPELRWASRGPRVRESRVFSCAPAFIQLSKGQLPPAMANEDLHVGPVSIDTSSLDIIVVILRVKYNCLRPVISNPGKTGEICFRIEAENREA